jgi:PAS domain S-box-containing protein
LQETCTRLDEALTEATDLYDFAPVGCISTDPEGKITKVNVAACRLLGQERQHLIGHDFAGFFLPGQRGRIHALIQQVNAAAEDLGCELTLDGDPSQATRVQWFVSPMAGALGYYMVLNDITAHKSVEEDLRTQVERWKFTLDATCDGVGLGCAVGLCKLFTQVGAAIWLPASAFWRWHGSLAPAGASRRLACTTGRPAKVPAWSQHTFAHGAPGALQGRQLEMDLVPGCGFCA